jgi:hypothetical protein
VCNRTFQHHPPVSLLQKYSPRHQLTSPSIELRLPLNFCGSVAFNSVKGRVTFSEDIQARPDALLRNVLSGVGTIGPPKIKNATGAGEHRFDDSFRFATINRPVFVSFYESGSPKMGRSKDTQG